MTGLRRLMLTAVFVLAAAAARAQVQTGSIAGVVTDQSSAVLPGVTVSLSGERLIGGAQAQTTDTTGAYRFDRLPPGTYTVRFELQGFREGVLGLVLSSLLAYYAGKAIYLARRASTDGPT